MAEQRNKLPTSATAEIDQLLRAAGEATRGGDDARGIDLAQRAWDTIPDPKTAWDFYPQIISKNMVGKYVKIGDKINTLKWIKNTHNSYDPAGNNHFALMIEGDALFKLGLEDDANKAFGKIFELYGRNGFKGDQLKYLEFYLNSTKK